MRKKEKSKSKNDIVQYKENKFFPFIFDIGIFMMMFVVSVICASTIAHYIDIFNKFTVTVLTCTFCLGMYGFYKRKNSSDLIIEFLKIAMAMILILLSAYVLSKIYEITWDGNSYHKNAIGILSEGWNPLKESSYDFNLKNNPEMVDRRVSLWMDHYPKATWEFGSYLRIMTGSVEAGKSITLIVMMATFLIIFTYSSMRYLNWWKSFILAITLSLTPIICSQFFSYYLDGLLGILLYQLITYLIILKDENFKYISESKKWLLVAINLIFIINIKFTGLFFAGIFVLGFYIKWLSTSIKNKNFKKEFCNLTFRFATIVIVSVCIFGCDSYVKNTIDHKMPLFPLFGKGKVDIITSMQPRSFNEKIGIIKLIESIYGETNNIGANSKESAPNVKIPFTLTDVEKENLSIPDTRIGGFGPIFSGLFTISMLIILIYVIYEIKNKKYNSNINIILIEILISTLMLSESWWARYAPQVYLIIPIAMYILFKASSKYSKIYSTITILIFTLILLNDSFFGYYRYKQFQYNRNIIYDFKQVKDKKIELALSVKDWYGILYNLKDYNVEYKIIKKEKFDNSMYNHFIDYTEIK